MDKQAFKQRMQNLKSYRENNPGKGYWDWKVQAYQNGGRHALGVGQVFASLADMLFNKERRTPAIAAAAYYTIHQTQNDPVLAPVEAPLVEPIADAIKSVDETPYDPGEVFLLSPENQKKQMTKNPNYRVVDTNSEEDPYGIVRRAAHYLPDVIMPPSQDSYNIEDILSEDQINAIKLFEDKKYFTQEESSRSNRILNKKML